MKLFQLLNQSVTNWEEANLRAQNAQSEELLGWQPRIRTDPTAPYTELLVNLNTIFYNFVRKHSAIGMTPAQASGIGYDLGEDKWLGLIRKAKQIAKN